MYYLKILTIFLLFSVVNCGVLIISPQFIEIPSLRLFDEKLYHSLKDSIDNGKIVSYMWELPTECGYFGNTRNSAYLPSVIYYPDDAIEFGDQNDLNCEQIREKFAELNKEEPHTIYLFINKPRKNKRSLEVLPTSASSSSSSSSPSPSSTLTTFSTTEEAIKSTERTYYGREKIIVDPDEPVLYNSNGKALLYSSKALVLKIQNETEMILGASAWVAVDERDSYTRLIATIPIDEGKITLRFKFPWESGYWWLKSVEIVDPEGKVYNLTVTSDVYAPKSFSYSCGGITEFTDGRTSLLLTNLQVQPVTKDGRFSDAYNCVPFTTVPIWSGLFITAILCIGLCIGLTALGSIKTMDKFDNNKTKQLTITVIGE